jgi:hypothetical protein
VRLGASALFETFCQEAMLGEPFEPPMLPQWSVTSSAAGS